MLVLDFDGALIMMLGQVVDDMECGMVRKLELFRVMECIGFGHSWGYFVIGSILECKWLYGLCLVMYENCIWNFIVILEGYVI